ncbi:MAG: flagellar basal body P-ring protein FlgI [Pirellulaceae bacterium]|nr:flagellar basal body P-ring protein FlgI [Pirellulaceae bacterium]
MTHDSGDVGFKKTVYQRLTLLLGFLAVCGCAQSTLRPTNLEVDALEDDNTAIKTIGTYMAPMGMNSTQVESVALITGLDGTGSDPPPSDRRARLIGEMQKHQVKHPNNILKSEQTSLAIVVGWLPPGIRKGERFDVEVRVPTKSQTASLRNGWLMPTRLSELAVLGDNAIHDGHVWARAEGPILVDSFVKGSDDKVNEVRGRILGGGVALRSRDLRLVMHSDQNSIRMTSLIGSAINARFHGYQKGIKHGMATPKTDQYIELKLDSQYQENIARYLKVIHQIPLRINTSEQVRYLQRLQEQLQDPATTSMAAIRLEAIGQDAVEVLASGLKSEDPTVQFHAAEALAYLGDAKGTRVLGDAIHHQPEYRQRGLIALAMMDDLDADNELEQLLHVDSVQSRYGAFRALRKRDPHDPLIPQFNMEGEFHLHVVESKSEPLVHLSWNERPEVVLFGEDIELQLPALVFAGKRIIVDGRHGNAVKVSMFHQEKGDIHEHCSANLADILDTISRLEGTYPEIVLFLRQAYERQYLTSRLALDSVPEFGGNLTHKQPIDSISFNTRPTGTNPLQSTTTPHTDPHLEVHGQGTESAVFATKKPLASTPPVPSGSPQSTKNSTSKFDKIKKGTESVSFAEAFE